jgi:uncharacterized protein (DUF302 family)
VSTRKRCPPALGLILAWLSLWSAGAIAEENLLMARSTLAFPEAMLALQESIKAHGYAVARVQRVDIGLTQAGFPTDKYRVVFFGRADEVRSLITKHPELTPYLPLNVSIFAEDGQTLIVSLNPGFLGSRFEDESTTATFVRWESDLRSIFDEFRRAEGE